MRSSVEACFTAALDIKQSLSGSVEPDARVSVAGVLISFDTVERRVLGGVGSGMFVLRSMIMYV